MKDLIQTRGDVIRKNEAGMQAIFDSSEYAIALLQLKRGLPDYMKLHLQDLNTIKHLLGGREPTRNLYHTVYVEKFEPDFFRIEHPQMTIVEYLYWKMRNISNTEVSDKYLGIDAGVSDIILKKEKEYLYAYYIDNTGFRQLKNFI